MKAQLFTLVIVTLSVGLLSSCDICTFKQEASVASVTIDITELRMTVGDADVKLTATVTPENARDKTVRWSSDKPDIVTVDEQGNVHAVAAGLATITAATKEGGKTAACEVKVIELYPKNVIKHADYLYEYTVENYSDNPPAALMSDLGLIPYRVGCSAVRNGNFYGRNLDFNINEICEFVVRTKATGNKHATIGVVNTCFLTILNNDVKQGLSDDLLKYLPWMTLDGINDAGLVCNVNVVNADDIKNFPPDHTNNGANQIMVMQLIRAILDNCESIAEAKMFINNHDIRPIPTTWDGHIMIADPDETVIVEFTGEKDKEVKYVELEQPIMTNFYNHLNPKQDGSFTAFACGIERYNILKDNYNIGNSMQGMWELMKKVRFTQTYDTNTNPFWCSEYYDTDKIPAYDGDHKFWTKEKILAQEGPAKEVAAYEKYKKTGEYNLQDGLWFTSHNSTFDIANRELWVTIREKYESVYKFEL